MFGRAHESLTSTSTETVPHDDRRLFVRRPAQGTVGGLVGRKFDPIHLELRDMSVSGVSGYADRSVNRGDPIILTFPSDGVTRSLNARGKIVRCEPSATGYRVAVQFDQLLGQAA